MTNNEQKNPMSVVAIFDNKGYSRDNYTILVQEDFPESDDYERTLVATNSVASIWSTSEDDSTWLNLENDEVVEAHIGVRITWLDLPQPLRKTLVSYFGLDPLLYPTHELGTV